MSTTMDTNKIREALRHLRDIGIVQAWPHVADHAREALAELDKAPKVLTDEEPYRVEKSSGVYVIVGPNGRWPFHFHDEKLAHIRARDFNRVYKITRDNYGIGAPPQGLTVEEAEDCLVEHLAQYGPDWSAPARIRLRARLTAAIEAKQHLNR